MRRGSSLRLALLAGLAVLALLARAAQAAPATGRCETTSGAGAADCPDATQLATIVNDGLGRTRWSLRAASTEAPMRIAVRLRPHGRRATPPPFASAARAAEPGISRIRARGAPRSRTPSASFWSSCSMSTLRRSRTRPPRRPCSRVRPGETTADLGVAGGVAEGLVGGWSPDGGTRRHAGLSAVGGAPRRRLAAVEVDRLRPGPRRGRPGDRAAGAVRVEARPPIAGRAGPVRAAAGRVDAGTRRRLRRQPRGQPTVAGGRRRGRHSGTAGTLARLGDRGRAVRPFREQRFVVGDLGTAYRSEPAAFMTTFAITTPIW